jgi:hypothetical protein
MKGKLNIKTIIVLIIILLSIVLSVLLVRTVSSFMTSAAAGFEPKGVSAVSDEDGKTASVSWLTDKEAMGVIEYGNSPATLLLRMEESEQTTSHKVTLKQLKPNVTYYFRIRIGDNVFDNNGVPYTFKTKGIVSETTPKPSPNASNEGVNVPTPTGAITTSGSGTILSPSIAVQKPTSDSTSSGTTNGACNRTTDYNKDGVINSLDYITCMKSGGSTASPSVAPTGTTTTTSNTTCENNVDYNKDGSINSLDRIKCLQDKSK